MLELWAARARPLVGEEGVAVTVHPLTGAVQRVAHGVLLSAHPDPLHQLPGGGVGGEAARHHPAQAELVEADPKISRTASVA